MTDISIKIDLDKCEKCKECYRLPFSIVLDSIECNIIHECEDGNYLGYYDNRFYRVLKIDNIEDINLSGIFR